MKQLRRVADALIRRGRGFGSTPRPSEVAGRIAAVFDAPFYCAAHPDVVQAGMSPLKHYLQHGWKEGRDPSPAFDVSWYLDTYPDVARAGAEPLQHYLDYGAAEGRWPAAGFDPAFYRSQLAAGLGAARSPLEHYLQTGAALGLRTLRPEEADLRPDAGGDPGVLGWSPSLSLLATARRTLDVHVATEPDLMALPDQLGALPILPRPTTQLDRQWRELFQSLRRRPGLIVLVASVDEAAAHDFLTALVECARELGCLPEVLALAVDEAFPSVGTRLPDALEWLSLAEIQPGGAGEARSLLLVALLQALRPVSTVCFGSATARGVLQRYHASFRSCGQIAIVQAGAVGSGPAGGPLPGLAASLMTADLLLTDMAPLPEADRLTHGLPLQEAARILPVYAAGEPGVFDRGSLRRLLAPLVPAHPGAGIAAP